MTLEPYRCRYLEEFEGILHDLYSLDRKDLDLKFCEGKDGNTYYSIQKCELGEAKESSERIAVLFQNFLRENRDYKFRSMHLSPTITSKLRSLYGTKLLDELNCNIQFRARDGFSFFVDSDSFKGVEFVEKEVFERFQLSSINEKVVDFSAFSRKVVRYFINFHKKCLGKKRLKLSFLIKVERLALEIKDSSLKVHCARKIQSVKLLKKINFIRNNLVRGDSAIYEILSDERFKRDLRTVEEDSVFVENLENVQRFHLDAVKASASLALVSVDRRERFLQEAYGAEDWAKRKADIGVVPPIPEEGFAFDPHKCDLVYFPPLINGEEVNEDSINKLLKLKGIFISGLEYGGVVKIGSCSFGSEMTAASGWMVVPKIPIPNSEGKSPEEQEELVKQLGEGFRLPNTIEAAIIYLLRCARLRTLMPSSGRTKEGDEYSAVGNFLMTGCDSLRGTLTNDYFVEEKGVYPIKSLN